MIYLQWSGEASTQVIELGNGWMNIYVAFSNVNVNAYLIAELRPIIDSGHLVQFVQHASDARVFAENNITTLLNPLYTVEDFGYNSGNLLTGLVHV